MNLAIDPSLSSASPQSGENPLNSASSSKRKLDDEYDEDDDDDLQGPNKRLNDGRGKKEPKKRGSKACTVCRKLKMKCKLNADGDGPCERCLNGNLECMFEASQRGKRKGMKAADAAIAAARRMVRSCLSGSRCAS